MQSKPSRHQSRRRLICDGQQFDLGPVVQFSHAVAEKPGETDDVILKLRQTARFYLVKAVLAELRSRPASNHRGPVTQAACPAEKSRTIVAGSPGFLEIRIQRTSIGTPNSHC